MGERDDAALVGTVLQDSYRLTRLIGAGGMGAVYEGVQLRLNKRVAVKLMVKDLAANQEALARFRREAEVTSHLGHPHIVNVFDFGSSPSGASYLVMEYLEGEDLDHRLRRTGRQSLDSTIHIVKQVASALAATHAKGVVHRDLKPANLFVLEVEGETDFIKVVDFGISKVRAATTKLTGASAVMGTPNYMSPEQARGQIDDIDHRTDQWSLACIAYEMLAGRGPFVGESAASLLYQVIHEEPPSLALKAPGLPPGVEQVIKRGLSKAMSDRYPNIVAFSRALEQAGSGRPADSEGAPRSAKLLSRVGAGEGRPGDKAAPAPSTTFSNTASEVLTQGTKSRLASKRVIGAAMAAAALLTIVVVLVSRSGPARSTVAAPEVGSLSPPSQPVPLAAVATAPAAPPHPPAAAPAAPGPSAQPAQRDEAAPSGSAQAPMTPRRAVRRESDDTPDGTLAHKSRGGSRSMSSSTSNGGGKLSAGAAATSPTGNVKKPGWVDPFEQETAPAKPAAGQDAKRPQKPKSRLIEDL